MQLSGLGLFEDRRCSPEPPDLGRLVSGPEFYRACAPEHDSACRAL